MFRKPAKRKEQAVRQRVETAPEDEEEKTEIVKDAIKRRRRDNPMLQSTKKREEKDNNDSSSSSDDEVVNEHAFPSSGIETSLGPSDRGATFVSEHDTAADADAHSQFERVQQILKEGGVEKDGKVLYKGMAMYGAKIAPDTAKGNAANGLNRIGPMRAPQFLRQTVRWDYAPDICKDYKETGFCTFGDSCKFMHDRGDYKHGWEIERDYLAGTLNQDDDTNYEIPLEEDELPEDCFICGNPFDNPIVTNCKHYFCESCAIQAFKKSKKCRICNENTGGIFNVAKDLIQKMKQREAAKEEEKEESGDEEEEEKPEIKQEMEEEDHHHHHEGCSHSHEVKEEAPGEEDEAGEDEEEEEVVEEEPQEEMDIKMEEIEDDDGNVSNSSDVEDEEKEE